MIPYYCRGSSDLSASAGLAQLHCSSCTKPQLAKRLHACVEVGQARMRLIALSGIHGHKIKIGSIKNQRTWYGNPIFSLPNPYMLSGTGAVADVQKAGA